MNPAALLRLGRGWALLLPVIPLCVMGALTIQATSDSDDIHYLTPTAMKQLIFMVVGLAGAIVIVAIGYHRLGRLSYVLFGLGMASLVYLAMSRAMSRWVNLPLVIPINGMRGWIKWGGFQLQPSELMKMFYVLALAWYLRYRRNYRNVFGLVAPFALTLVPMALILMQPDLGTTLMFLPVLFAMLFAAGAKTKHLMVIVFLAFLASPFFWIEMKGYQRLRIMAVALQNPTMRTFFEERPQLWDRLQGGSAASRTPSARADWHRQLTNWEDVTGYQLVRSKLAIGSGGFAGHGWKQGIFAEYNFLPEKHNDFIFAMIGHQWGFLGSLLMLACYVVLFVMGCEIATVTNDPFGRLLAVGMSTMLAFQTLTNLCVAIGLGPITGVTLPFVSAGGSSIISSFLCVGVMVSIAQRRPLLIANPPFVFDEEAERYSPA